jgi:hypothetical protein
VSEIPQQTLSAHIEARMKGRRLVAAVFTTYRFDPGFFEREVLPLFFDVGFSHVGTVRLAQLEDALRSDACEVAVYYDRGGLVAGAEGARLDVRRHPMHVKKGVFHPKNLFALVEAIEPDDDGHRPRTLLCACLSANLTRAGWWENVEVAHVEEITEGMSTRLQIGLLPHLEGLIRRATPARHDDPRDGHEALRAIRGFVRQTQPIAQRSAQGVTHTHFYDGRASVPDFMRDVVGDKVKGWHLEVISPYFDDADDCAPLDALIEAFAPASVRVLLPCNARDELTCTPGIYEAVRQKLNVAWARLPDEMRALGDARHATQRVVHAKVYRFYERSRGGHEVLFVGSANLTTPGFRLNPGSGNVESGMLVHRVPRGTREPWLQPLASKTPVFARSTKDDEALAPQGTALQLRFDWTDLSAHARWSDPARSPALTIEHGGAALFTLSPLTRDDGWRPLGSAEAGALHKVLPSTSIVSVCEPTQPPALLLVQEEGMAHRPSLIEDLSPADILRYWSLLSVEQRAAFVATRVVMSLDGDLPTLRAEQAGEEASLFDRFAGIFHAFARLEESVRASLKASHGREGSSPREAVYRLFGAKYDSLPTLLERVREVSDKPDADPLEAYVVTLCAEQLLHETRREFPEFYAEHPADLARLKKALAHKDITREKIRARNPQTRDMDEFLRWFEQSFLKRARPQTPEAS